MSGWLLGLLLLQRICFVNSSPISFHSTYSNNNSRPSPLGSAPSRPLYSNPHKEYDEDLLECDGACASEFTGILDGFLISTTGAHDLVDVCNQYSDAVSCMRPLTHCSNRDTFDTLTSGVRYLCVDQREAFDALIGCIDANTNSVRKLCESHCHATELMAGLALKDLIGLIKVPIVDVRRLIESNMGNIMLSEGCRIGACLMNCYKSEYNNMCEGTAGSLIMEALGRPLSSPTTTSFSVLSLLKGLLPHHCGFLTNDEGFNSLRISKAEDADIKRMYRGRKKLSEIDVESVGSPVSEGANPFMKVDKSRDSNTPLDNY